MLPFLSSGRLILTEIAKPKIKIGLGGADTGRMSTYDKKTIMPPAFL